VPTDTPERAAMSFILILSVILPLRLICSYVCAKLTIKVELCESTAVYFVAHNKKIGILFLLSGFYG